ncbi:alpha/beta hydrolase family protein [Streptomyces roseicoloratus]|uniref:alpha/beta hydrolase family protein n=1 Tax=Streptomyces roseicoloratus TaxID=2508722 RepID=UPI001009B9C6|nr:alpha/beta fold hydrolase [Streptomyces roseicoloratus]
MTAPDVLTDELVVPYADAGGGGEGRIVARVTRPAAGRVGAVLLLWPALGVSASYYAPLADELARRGVATVAADLRGQGASRPRCGRGTRHGYQDFAAHDWPKLVRSVRELFPRGTPVHLLGHSIGGQVSLLYVARPEADVDGLVLVASGTVHHRSFPGARRFGVLFGTQLAALVSRVLGYYPGHRLGFGGRQAGRVMRDWARIGRTGRFEPTGADLDYEAAFAKVRLPVLAVSVAGDALAPPSAVDALCGRLAGCAVTRVHHTPASASHHGHTRWARDAEGVARHLIAWLNQLSAPPGAVR